MIQFYLYKLDIKTVESKVIYLPGYLTNIVLERSRTNRINKTFLVFQNVQIYKFIKYVLERYLSIWNVL